MNLSGRVDGKIDGKIALVTGASRGIGRAVAAALAARGARVALHYHRDRAAAETARGDLPGTGHGIFQADLGSGDGPRQLAEKVASALGPVAVLVNNAGIYENHPLAETDLEAWQAAWRRTLSTNLTGPADLIHAVGQGMIREGSGRIVNVTSRGAFRGEPDAPAYGAAKAGLNSLSQSLAKALAPHGVLVFAVAPGWVATDMARPYLEGPGGAAIRAQSPLGRAAEPEEVASAVAYLAADAPAYMTGAILDVNGASYLRS